MSSIKKIVAKESSFFWAVPAVTWQVLFFYIPVALIFLISFFRVGVSGGFPTATLENYIYFLSPSFFLVILRSLLLGLVNGILCLLCAYPVAYCLAIKINRFKNLFLFFLILPFWTSLMVQVYSWFFVLEHNGLLNTILLKLGMIQQPLHLLNNTFAIYLVMVYCYLPFMIMPLYSALEKIDRRVFEAAADLGATQWQTFIRVTVPLSMAGIRTGFFLVFVPSFGELVVPILLGGGKQLFVGPLIMQYFLSARNPALGAAFTCISSIILLAAVGLLYLFFKKCMGNPTAKGKM